MQEADNGHHRLLRARRERPRGRCAAEQCDEIAPPHFPPSPLTYNFLSLTGKHPVTWCQHILRVELRLRCLDDLPGRSIVPFPVVLRHRNRARRHAVTTYVAGPFIER